VLLATWPYGRLSGQVNFPPVKAECLKNGILGKFRSSAGWRRASL
jgi:hypothetical protein